MEPSLWRRREVPAAGQLTCLPCVSATHKPRPCEPTTRPQSCRTLTAAYRIAPPDPADGPPEELSLCGTLLVVEPESTREGATFRGHSVETELVALDVLHHEARLVEAIGKQ